jgi:hypothetical protein
MERQRDRKTGKENIEKERHRDGKTEKERHRDGKIEKERHTEGKT